MLASSLITLASINTVKMEALLLQSGARPRFDQAIIIIIIWSSSASAQVLDKSSLDRGHATRPAKSLSRPLTGPPLEDSPRAMSQTECAGVQGTNNDELLGGGTSQLRNNASDARIPASG